MTITVSTTSNWRKGLPLAVIGALLLPACMTVDPKPDYARTRELATTATGIDEIFDPSATEAAAQRVRELLTDGLSDDEAVRIAILNNRGFQARFHEIGASRADVVQSGLMSNPSLSLSLRFPEGGGRSNFTAGFAQQVVDLWQIPVRKKIAESELEQVIFDVADQAVRLCAQVKQAFYLALAAEQAEALSRQNLELVQQSVDLARKRFQAGEVGIIDVNLVQANLITVQVDAIAARRAREETTNQLSRLMGLSRTESAWKLSGSWPDNMDGTTDGNALLLVAMEQRFDARIAALRVKAAQAELEKQCRSVFPNVTIGLEGERPERRALPGRTVLADTARTSIASGGLTAPTIQSRAERQRERSQIIDLLLGPTLDITLPIWDQNQAQIAKAGYRVLQLRSAYEDLLDGVAQEVSDALSIIRAAQELVRFYESDALPHAKQSVNAARQTYEAGEQNVIALIEAQETLIARQQAQVNAWRDLALAQAELERAVGGVNDRNVNRVSHVDLTESEAKGTGP